MTEILLWDIDGTLLNFSAAERAALQTCFSVFRLGTCTEEMRKRYSQINKKYWLLLETGKISKAEALDKRFEEFFASEGILFDEIEAFNREYQLRLGDTVVFFDNGYDLVKNLRGRVKQYAVTNGTYLAQSRKLKESGLDLLFDGIFISEKVGFEKPSPKFFDAVFAQIGNVDKSRILIVGDSLTSDMLGGNNAGIRCCWYNPKNEPVRGDVKIDYVIQNLNQVWKVLETR